MPGRPLASCCSRPTPTPGSLASSTTSTRWSCSRAADWRVPSGSSAQRLDVCVDCGSWPRLDALLVVLSGARWTVGRRRAAAPPLRVRLRRAHSSTDHELENFRRLVRSLGVDSTSPPHLHGPARPAAARGAVRRAAPWPGGANSRERSWPERHWRGARRARSTPGAHRRADGRARRRRPPPRRSSTPGARQGIRATPQPVGHPPSCARWLGTRRRRRVNTGVMHVAAALGVPTVASAGRRRVGDGGRSVTRPMRRITRRPRRLSRSGLRTRRPLPGLHGRDLRRRGPRSLGRAPARRRSGRAPDRAGR